MYKIFSVDDHIVEPAHVWDSRVPAKFKERAPHVVEQDGREFWVYEEQRCPTMGLNAVAGKPRDQWTMEPARFSDMIPGCYDPKERARDLLSQGVLASISFPTLPRFGGMLFNSFADKELADVCVQAWNDFVLDEWCPAGPPGLFVPMTICQVWDPEKAAAEVRRCVDKGTRALAFVENPVPDGLPGFHSDFWDPLWRACEETGIPVCMHIGSSGFIPIPDPKAPMTGIMSLAVFTGMLAMTNLLISPVCHNFPDLKLVFSEAGIGWVPALLERVDRTVDRNEWVGRPDLLPSDIFRRNMHVCMVEEPVGMSLYELIGVDRILAETDYPHSDSTYPYVQKSFTHVFDGIPDDVVEAVSHTNAERLFNWTMADESLVSSPDVSSWRATLEEDPFAAMKLRHDVDGVVRRQETGGLCTAVVITNSGSSACGRPLGAGGTCDLGHRP